uniref:Uncharacterized protein n=1 Tax=Moniliophthora roreri TaxID=221103 RepID=A0A0W0GCL3_MONRR
MSTNASASTSASSSSASNQAQGLPSSTPTEAGEGRSPPPTPSEMWMDCASALCANWTAISPETAQATFAGDASTMHLDISLQGALSTDGLHNFCMEGLVWIVVLCQTITIIMMMDTTVTMENDDQVFVINTDTERREFLFMGVNPKKVRLVDIKKGVEERMMEGWQPGSSQAEVTTGMELDRTPDKSQKYDNKSYNEGESEWAPNEL